MSCVTELVVPPFCPAVSATVNVKVSLLFPKL